MSKEGGYLNTELHFGNIKCTRDMEEVSTLEMQIAERARRNPDEPLTNLHSFIDCRMLNESLGMLNRESAPGVDGQTWSQYCDSCMDSIPELHKAFKSGQYRAPHIRRTYIPKGEGQLRPLGLPTVEDKVLQRAVTRVLTPVYEEVFLDCSYGYRGGKSAHDALNELFHRVSFEGGRYIIDADIQDYFGSIDHQCLREFLDLRIKDGVIRKQIDKWLKAGILEGNQVSYPKEGTPQGGIISPLLSNIYLHYVLDDWFTNQIRPLLKGQSSMIRYADDFVMCFTNKTDAYRVLKVLGKRLSKYGLTLHPEKTRLIELDRKDDRRNRTFDFLGFTHYMSYSRKGHRILKRKTSKKKLRMAMTKMSHWLRINRHIGVKDLIYKVNLKLRGYYGYYGITFNSRSIKTYFQQVKRLLFKWLNRRGGRKWNWLEYRKIVDEYCLLLRPRIYHSYR